MNIDGDDLREQPLLARRKALARLLRRSQDGIVFNEHMEEEGAVVFAHACKLGAEGIVSKRIDAPYRSGPDQGPQPREHRRAARAKRKLEQVIGPAASPAAPRARTRSI